ncbi:MAG: hypothetical protein U0271_48420 [Polyangiaceae bacterium]
MAGRGRMDRAVQRRGLGVGRDVAPKQDDPGAVAAGERALRALAELRPWKPGHEELACERGRARRHDALSTGWRRARQRCRLRAAGRRRARARLRARAFDRPRRRGRPPIAVALGDEDPRRAARERSVDVLGERALGCDAEAELARSVGELGEREVLAPERAHERGDGVGARGARAPELALLEEDVTRDDAGVACGGARPLAELEGPARDEALASDERDARPAHHAEVCVRRDEHDRVVDGLERARWPRAGEGRSGREARGPRASERDHLVERAAASAAARGH